MKPGHLPLSIDVAIEADIWSDKPQARDEEWEEWIAAQLAPLFTLSDFRLGELSIALTNDGHMQTLNNQYRGKDASTNVLSFPASGPLLGDIVLSHDTLAREASAKSAPFLAHMSHLLIHGFLHLQGYDHQDEASAAEMEAIEITALAALGIDNPYEK